MYLPSFYRQWWRVRPRRTAHFSLRFSATSAATTRSASFSDAPSSFETDVDLQSSHLEKTERSDSDNARWQELMAEMGGAENLLKASPLHATEVNSDILRISRVMKSELGAPPPACAPFLSPKMKSHKYRPRKTVPGFYGRTLPAEICIDFATPEGKKMFGEALANGQLESYFLVAGQYTHQSEPAFCGVTVLVLALNSLSIDPARVWKGPWRWYSEDMMACCRPLDAIKTSGITLDEFTALARCKGLTVNTRRFEQSALEQFRGDVIRAVSGGKELVVTAYSRKGLGQTGDGHYAPVVGYHAESDRVLLLDVARFKYPPHWVPLAALHAAMESKDSVTGQSRGYCIVRAPLNDAEIDDDALACAIDPLEK